MSIYKRGNKGGAVTSNQVSMEDKTNPEFALDCNTAASGRGSLSLEMIFTSGLLIGAGQF